MWFFVRSGSCLDVRIHLVILAWDWVILAYGFLLGARPSPRLTRLNFLSSRRTDEFLTTIAESLACELRRRRPAVRAAASERPLDFIDQPPAAAAIGSFWPSRNARMPPCEGTRHGRPMMGAPDDILARASRYNARLTRTMVVQFENVPIVLRQS